MITERRENVEIVSAENLLAKLRAGTKEVYEIKLRQLIVPVRVISLDEISAIRREAKAEQAKMLGDETDFNVSMQKFTLKLASNIKDAPLLSDKLLSKLTIDEVNHLYNEYIRVMDAVNPTLEAISPEHFRSMVEALKKSQVTLNELSLRELKALSSAFVEMIREQETPS